MQIIPLSYPVDIDRTRGVFDAATDYVFLEYGTAPDDAVVKAFFHERPDTVPAANCHHIGIEQGGDLVGLAGYLFGFPTPTDCYIGLMILDASVRGKGIGTQVVKHIVETARRQGATRLLIAVLDENPKGRAFWLAQGFRHLQTFAPTTDGHIRHRMGRDL